MTTTTNLSRESASAVRIEPSEVSTSTPGVRVAVVAGIAFVVINVIGSFAPGAPPASDASAAEIAVYFRDHAGGIKVQLLLGGLGIAALIWWFGALFRLMSRAEGERPRLATVAGIGLASGVTLALVSGTFTAAAATRPGSAESAHLLYTLSLLAVDAGGFGLGVFLIAASVLAYRTRFVPRWTSYIGGLAALAFLVGGFGAITDANAVNQIAFGAFFVWCVWIVSVSVSMWRGAARSA